MTTDLTAYLPPGVYIEDQTTPLVNVIGVNSTVIAIIGPAAGAQTYIETVVLNGTSDVLLTKTGIDDSTVVVKSRSGEEFTLDDDYVLTPGDGEDDVSDTGDDTLSIRRNGSGAIDDGQSVQVTYSYTNVEYHDPKRLTNFEDAKAAFGEPIDPDTSEILSPLSFACKFAFENGAQQVVGVATDGSSTATSRSEIQDALAKTESLFDVNVVVVLPVGMGGTDMAPQDTYNVGQDLQQHCESLALEGLFRVAVYGLDKSNTTTPSTNVSNFSSSRVVEVWPNELLYYNGLANQTVSVSGYYLAAGIAGMLTQFPVRTSLTKKNVRSFVGIPQSVITAMTPTVKNGYSAAGVLVVELGRQGRPPLTIRHSVTTDASAINTRELSLVRSKDALVDLINTTIDHAELIGTPIDVDTPARIKAVMAGILETAINNDTINGYTNLLVRTRPTDPTVIEVKFQYQPAYPLNYVIVSFAIDTNSGDTTLLDNQQNA